MLICYNKLINIKEREFGYDSGNDTIIAAAFNAGGNFIMLWRLLQTRRQQGQELGAEVNSQLESLERRFYENVRDLRSEQNTLARAARMESQAASDRLGEQLDKKLEKLTESTAANLEQIRQTVDENCSRLWNGGWENPFSRSACGWSRFIEG